MPVLPDPTYVNWVRRSLNRLFATGMPPLPENGKKGSEYELRVAGFQAYEQIKDDGIVGPVTQNRLIRANILSSDYRRWIRDVINKKLPGTMTGAGPWTKPVDPGAVMDVVRKYT